MIINDFINLIFPKICASCDQPLTDGEICICTLCRADLPLSNDELLEENETKKVFYGRIPIEKASSLLHYEKGGIVQNIMHDLKYRGNQEVGEVLGNWHAQLLAENGWKNQFDTVIPVPIHKQRLRDRGYNQVDKYAMAFADLLNATFSANILGRNKKSTQVFKNRIARTKVTQSDFYLLHNNTPTLLKHILLVDDIITTGATIEACCRELYKIPDVKISIASMALAR